MCIKIKELLSKQFSNGAVKMLLQMEPKSELLKERKLNDFCKEEMNSSKHTNNCTIIHRATAEPQNTALQATKIFSTRDLYHRK